MTARPQRTFLLPYFVLAILTAGAATALLGSGALYDLTGGNQVGLVFTVAAAAVAFLSVFAAVTVLLLVASRRVRSTPAPPGRGGRARRGL